MATRKIAFFSVLILISTAFIACNRKQEKTEIKKEEKNEAKIIEPHYDNSLPGKEGIVNDIKAYNMALRNAQLADPYFRVLRKFAADNEVQRVYIEVKYNADRGVAMRSWQKELIFENISSSEKAGFADTNEVWDFEYVDIKSKEHKVVEPKSRVRYKLRYTVEKEDGKWVISKIRERRPRLFEPLNEK